MAEKPGNNGQAQAPTPPGHGADGAYTKPVHGAPTRPAPAGGARSLAAEFRAVLDLSNEVPDRVVFAEAQARLAQAEGVVLDNGPLAQWRKADDEKKAAKEKAASKK